MTRTLRRLIATVLLLFPLAALAQVDAEVVGGTASALPIAVVPFAGSTGENKESGASSPRISRAPAPSACCPTATSSSARRVRAK